MKMLQIGLGSMGKRRIRNMQSVGVSDIIGFDLREDRRAEATEKYGVKTVAELPDDLIAGRDAFIISTPPDKHNPYMKLALEKNKAAFVEASVIRAGLDEIDRLAREKGVLIAPSCTLRFHPSIKRIKEIVASGRYGRICSFIYHMGQYLPDWHPWENVRDFYVGQKKTGGSREMVPFELTWLVDIAGKPEKVFAFYGKTLDMGVDIDDTYAISLKYPSSMGVLLVNVTARYAARSFCCNLERGQIVWNWDEHMVKIYEAEAGNWMHIYDPVGKAAEGYNVNIVEEMYIEELKTFMEAAQGKTNFPNTLEEDIYILSILESAEQTADGTAVK